MSTDAPLPSGSPNTPTIYEIVALLKYGASTAAAYQDSHPGDHTLPSGQRAPTWRDFVRVAESLSDSDSLVLVLTKEEAKELDSQLPFLGLTPDEPCYAIRAKLRAAQEESRHG